MSFGTKMQHNEIKPNQHEQINVWYVLPLPFTKAWQ